MRKLSSVILADLVTSKRKEKSMTQQSLAEATGQPTLQPEITSRAE